MTNKFQFPKCGVIKIGDVEIPFVEDSSIPENEVYIISKKYIDELVKLSSLTVEIPEGTYKERLKWAGSFRGGKTITKDLIYKDEKKEEE